MGYSVHGGKQLMLGSKLKTCNLWLLSFYAARNSCRITQKPHCL